MLKYRSVGAAALGDLAVYFAGFLTPFLGATQTLDVQMRTEENCLEAKSVLGKFKKVLGVLPSL